jgi:adenine-specific DNA-methyltransferase
MTAYEGRLELTWTNKDQRLLAHEDGSYEWLSPADYRVAEVRLLHDASSVGDVGKTRAADNLLIRGDALNALTSLSRLPEFAAQYLGKVKLAYIDPPFNTQQSFLQYDDNLEHSVWLTMMRDRLLQIKDLLAPDGSVWIHLDDSEMAYCKVMLDELFGRENFIASVVWEKTYTPKSNGRGLSTDHDYILCYAKDASVWLSGGWNFLPRSDEQESRFKNPDDDPRGPWRTYPLDVRTENEERRAAYRYSVTLPSGRVVTPAQGRHWALPEERLEKERSEGLLWFGTRGDAMPTRKVYLAEAREGVIARTWWPHDETGSSQDGKREIKTLFPDVEPFATPKPEKLLHRILQVASNPGDTVLDCFVGSGTTAAVAQKMGRRWVAVEREAETVEDFALPRLKKVVAGDDPGGISERADWSGGGGFRVLDVAESMFEADDGMVFLADWMTNGALAEATAAQLGFPYEDSPPFAGQKGRTRLAVVDGVVNEAVARILVSALPEEQRIVVCGTGIDTDARPVLRELRPGSTLRKIPAALLDEYRSARQLSLEVSEEDVAPDANGTAPAIAKV